MGEKIFVTVFPSFATLSNVTFLCDFTGETDTGLHSVYAVNSNLIKMLVFNPQSFFQVTGYYCCNLQYDLS